MLLSIPYAPHDNDHNVLTISSGRALRIKQHAANIDFRNPQGLNNICGQSPLISHHNHFRK